jgi:hypothetical protein
MFLDLFISTNQPSFFFKLEVIITQNGGLIQDGVKRAKIFNQSPKLQMWSNSKNFFYGR